MFSFFKQKKPSPTSSPESDPIPSASDFVFVEQKQGGADPNPTHMPMPLYPNFGSVGQYGPTGIPIGIPPGYPPPAGGYPPPLPNRPNLQHSDSIQNTYISGVPFKLSPDITTGDSDEITKIQVNDILELITSKMEVTKADYDFTLERSILQQSEQETTEEEEAE